MEIGISTNINMTKLKEIDHNELRNISTRVLWSVDERRLSKTEDERRVTQSENYPDYPSQKTNAEYPNHDSIHE